MMEINTISRYRMERSRLEAGSSSRRALVGRLREVAGGWVRGDSGLRRTPRGRRCLWCHSARRSGVGGRAVEGGGERGGGGGELAAWGGGWGGWGVWAVLRRGGGGF